MDLGPSDAIELANTLNAMKPVAIWAFVILVGMVAIYMITVQVIKAKREARLDRSKEDRANAYNATIANLSTAINSQTKEIHSMVQTFETNLGSLRDSSENARSTIRSVEKVVAGLKDRLDEKMSFSDSLRLIDTYFHRVESAAIDVITNALIVNNYRSRRDFVASRVRTDIGTFIDLMRSDLAEYKLSFSYEVFLRTYIKETNEGGERYILCDKVWDAVAHLFENEDNDPVEQRIQESRLLIINAVRDQYSHIARRVMTRHTQGRAPDQETDRYVNPNHTRPLSRVPSDRFTNPS